MGVTGLSVYGVEMEYWAVSAGRWRAVVLGTARGS